MSFQWNFRGCFESRLLGKLASEHILHMVMVFAVLCMALLNSPTAIAQSSKLLIMGDSLSAEYGIPRGTGWVKLLENRLKKKYPEIQVINASISGETTLGGQMRLASLL